MDKYKGKYRIASARWAAWDYGSNASYFVTICTAGHTHDFGRVVDGEMILTPLGQAAVDCWHAIPDHFPFVVLDGFVAMPNHVHGIITIDKPGDGGGGDDAGGGDDGGGDDDAGGGDDAVETQDFASLPASQQKTPKNRFGPQSKNLASIVRGYKIGVTKFARQHDIPFKWQARYHDHVIRNEGEYKRIRKYIEENPQKWDEDRYCTPSPSPSPP